MKDEGQARDVLITRILAAGAAAWAAAWLVLVMTPTGDVPLFDRTYGLMISPFANSGGGDFLVQRIVELLGLLPAAFLLVAAQERRQRRLEERLRSS
jgi:hypothetical protein